MLACACGTHDKADAGVPDPTAAMLERGKALLAAPSLPPRPEALALAESVQAQADKEGAGARALELHALAGRIFERVYRTEGQEQDAKEAALAYGAAAHDPKLPGACDAAVRAAVLAGDAARDAQTTYEELYRVTRRFARAPGGAGAAAADGAAPPAGAGCPAAEKLLAAVAPFRPPARVLSAIDAALAAEGALGAAATSGYDAGAVPVPGPAHVVRVEHWPGRDSARVVIVLSKPATFRAGDEVAQGGGARRTFVELDGVDLGGAARSTPGSGIVTGVRVDPTTTGTRVTLDLDGGQAYRRVFHLLEPYRVVVDVARRPPGAGDVGSRRVQRVVLDPGHGGNDSGASGPDGLKEKDVTLDIAKKAARVLGEAGLEVVLTRDDDRYVTLEARTARANQLAADLFVSIHCNAAENHARHGVETYVLDTTKDDIAARVAARENATSEGANAELGSILASMRLADQASHSTRLAELLQKAAMGSLHASWPDEKDGGVHPAGFYVLVGARMPAVLFETSYISNPTEEKRLASDSYREALADALANAVRAYREGR